VISGQGEEDERIKKKLLEIEARIERTEKEKEEVSRKL
jgi:hypothetical protein